MAVPLINFFWFFWHPCSTEGSSMGDALSHQVGKGNFASYFSKLIKVNRLNIDCKGVVVRGNLVWEKMEQASLLSLPIVLFPSSTVVQDFINAVAASQTSVVWAQYHFCGLWQLLPFLNKNSKMQTLRETNDTENLLKAGWGRKERRRWRKSPAPTHPFVLWPVWPFLDTPRRNKALKWNGRVSNEERIVCSISTGPPMARAGLAALPQLSLCDPLVTRYYLGTCYQGLRIRPVAADVERTWHVHKAGHRGWLHILKPNTSQSN